MLVVILEQSSTLFVYLLIGFALARFDKISSKGIQEASFFLTNFALTCAVFDSFQTDFSQEKLRLIIQAFLVALLFIIFSIVISYLVTKFLNIDLGKRAIWQGCCIFSSILFIGIPIVDALYGEVGLILLVSFNTVFNLFLFGMGESIFSGKITFSFTKIVQTPAIIAMLLGFLIFLLDWQLPVFFTTPVKVIGSFTAPLSMMINGAMFYGSPLIQLLKDKDVLLFCLVRLLLLPILTIVVFRSFIQNDLLFAILVLVSAMPSGSMNAIFAEKYQRKGQLATNYVIASTLFSLVTIPIILMLGQWL